MLEMERWKEKKDKVFQFITSYLNGSFGSGFMVCVLFIFCWLFPGILLGRFPVSFVLDCVELLANPLPCFSLVVKSAFYCAQNGIVFSSMRHASF